MATDKLVDFDHVTDYISREAAISEIMSEPTDAHYPSWYAEKLKQIPAANVRPVVRGKWKPHPTNRCRDVCSNCGVSTLRRKYGINPDGTEWEEEESYQFCPWCAAYMREPNLDTTKGDNHD